MEMEMDKTRAYLDRYAQVHTTVLGVVYERLGSYMQLSMHDLDRLAVLTEKNVVIEELAEGDYSNFREMQYAIDGEWDRLLEGAGAAHNDEAESDCLGKAMDALDTGGTSWGDVQEFLVAWFSSPRI